MSSIVLAGRSYRYGSTIFQSRHSSHILLISRAASLNSAIGRGLRKSKGIGFRGREAPRERTENSTDKDRHESRGVIRRTADPPLSISKGRLTYDAWRKERAPLQRADGAGPGSNSSSFGQRRRHRAINDEQDHLHISPRYDRRGEAGSALRVRRGKKDIAETETRPKRRSRAARFNDPNYSFGKRALERRAARITRVQDQDEGDDQFERDQRSGIDSRHKQGRTRPTMTSAARRAAESDRVALMRNPSGSKVSKGRQAYLSRVAESSQRRSSEEIYVSQDYKPARDSQEYAHRHKDWQAPSTDHQFNRDISPAQDNDNTRPKVPRMINDRLPLSIPYTTPASEFLYGTSVVEAALRSRREPCRKLYKLYVYKGENREPANGQDAIERLASRNNVPIVYHTESPRLLDKMSGGRPHNGYILEASPLPKLPLVSLGSLTADGHSGFTINLDHQSREDAAINGTSNFIPILNSNRPTRKPFVLFLDSILDPGNLGGIIRTASFLGITAIALSTRNSASLSPIVLKASAGASESTTLFSVNKPAGFIAESKRAGWKVYAAVAPRAPSNPGASNNSSSRGHLSREASSSSNSHFTSYVPAITTDDLLLSRPLDHDPCILMLGNEGEGLRANLRSKADVEISIAGSAQQGGGVDSLNVSVAAGVLCQAFLSRVGTLSRNGGVAGRAGRDETQRRGAREAPDVGDKADGKEVGGGMDLF